MGSYILTRLPYNAVIFKKFINLKIYLSKNATIFSDKKLNYAGNKQVRLAD